MKDALMIGLSYLEVVDISIFIFEFLLTGYQKCLYY